mmetsp:Transcript_116843/g.330581  ORF Transcript_116843/g.330581 Transcript_116843/m.330581 type:complete len:100 (+) Transcript_116843:110-409(+)
MAERAVFLSESSEAQSATFLPGAIETSRDLKSALKRGGAVDRQNARRDRRGNLILKGPACNHKCTFADQIEGRDNFIEVIEVEDLYAGEEKKGCSCTIS